MKITVPAETLRAALSRCAKVASAKVAIPILATVKIEATSEGVRVYATNLDTYVAVALRDAEIEAEGVRCVPAADLLKFATLARKASMTLADGGVGAMRITWGNTKAELRTLEPGDFPATVGVSAAAVEVDGLALAAAIKACAPAAADDETRYYLCGVAIQPDSSGSGARLYGTDGRRAHRIEIPGAAVAESVIMRTSDAALVAELATAAAAAFRLEVSPTRWAARAGDVECWGKVIDGTFPDMERVLAGGREIFAIVNREALREGVEIAAAGAGEGKQTAQIVIDAAGGEIALRGFNPGGTLARGTSTAVEAETMAPTKGVYTAPLVLDALAAVPGERVALLTAAGGMRLEIEPVEQPEAMRTRAVVMALRASEAEMAA